MSTDRAGRDLAPQLDMDAPWELHPRVSLRRERFGALAYNFDTRRLCTLNSSKLAEVVASLAGEPSAISACRAAGVQDRELPQYARALTVLARGQMIAPRRAS